MNTLIKYKSLLAFLGFAIIWLVLSCYNRVSLDDWCLTNFVKDVTFKEFMVDFWYNYEGAFSSVATNFIVFKFISHSHFFSVIFNEAVLVGLLLSLVFIIQVLAKRLDVSISNFFSVSLALIIFFSFYIFQPQHKGVFFNYNWSICYFLPISIFIFALGLLLQNRNSSTVLAVFLFFMLGAWKLHYSLMFIFVLATLFLINLYFKGKTELQRKIIFSILALIVSTSIYLIAPGNFARLARVNSTHQTTVLQNLMNTKLVNWFLFLKNIVYHPANLGVVILLFIFFSMMKYDVLNKANRFILDNYKKVFIYVTVWISLIIFFNGFFFEVIAGEISYNARVYVLMYFFIAIYCVFIAYFISLKVQLKFLTGSKYVSALVILVILTYFLSKLPQAMDYARAFDKREVAIEKEISNNRTTDLYVRALPESGIFETGEFTCKGDSSMSFVNDCAKEYYNTRFNIYQVEKMNY